LSWFLIEKSLEESLEGRRDIIGELDRFIDDHLYESIDIIGVEWRLSYEKFVENDS
jgi:hypothetical protein